MATVGRLIDTGQTPASNIRLRAASRRPYVHKPHRPSYRPIQAATYGPLRSVALKTACAAMRMNDYRPRETIMCPTRCVTLWRHSLAPATDARACVRRWNCWRQIGRWDTASRNTARLQPPSSFQVDLVSIRSRTPGTSVHVRSRSRRS